MTVALVMSLPGTIHRQGCRFAGRVYKCVTPDIALEEIAEFLRVRRFVGCGACLRDYRVVAP